MNACPKCNDVGYLAILNGDNDVTCPNCNPLDDVNPAPVIVRMGGYEAKVVNCDGIYILFLSYLDTPLSLMNSFCKDFHMLMALGRALYTACNDHKEPTETFGYSYGIGEVTYTGWLVQRGEMIPMIPSIHSRGSGRECGKVLMELGLEMEKRRKMAVWMGELMFDLKLAG